MSMRMVRAVALKTTSARGVDVRATGAAIMVPVGDCVLGRLLNAITTILIDRMDAIDADFEFDDEDRCVAGDDGCGLLVIPSSGRAVLGSDHVERGE